MIFCAVDKQVDVEIRGIWISVWIPECPGLGFIFPRRHLRVMLGPVFIDIAWGDGLDRSLENQQKDGESV